MAREMLHVGFEDGGKNPAKECRWPQKAGKGEEMKSSLDFLEKKKNNNPADILI